MSRPTLPPGFRFHPTDGELVQYYLKRKVLGKPLRFEAISEIDIYKFAPWDLREKSCLKNRDLEWYFFCPRDKKYASGPRTNRTTEIGYWKTTGKDRTVRHNSQIVGMKKTLVFHTGRSPRGIRTDWVMHEYRLEDKDLATAGIFQGAYVLCRIFQKSGPGPRNGEQYGAPFREEDWEDDVNDPFSLPLADPGSPSILLDDDQNVSIVPGSAFGSSLEPIPCQAGPSNNTSDHTLPEDDDIVSLLALFGNEEEVLVSTSNVSSESPQSSNVGVAHLDGYGFYNSLEDIITLEELNKIHFPSSCLEAEYPLDQTHIWGSSSFLELKDLELPLEDPTVHGADNLFLDPLACNSNYDNIEGLPGPALPLALPALGLSRCNTLPEGSSIEEELAPFFKDNGNGANASGGQDALYNISSSSKNFQEGGKQQALARGGPQKASFSRLQYLLHSVPARPTFAAEYLFPTNREKGAMDSRMMYPYGGSGSSIQVKVDVIITCGSTKDGLSDKYEEFPCVSCYGCNLSWLGFGKQAVTRSKLVYIRFLTGNGFCFPDYWNYQLFTQSHPLIGISISIWKSVSILTSL